MGIDENVQKYDTIYEQEIRAFARWVSIRCKEFNLAQYLKDTVTLQYFFFNSVLEMIWAAFSCLSIRNTLGYQIIMRSILEHLIDMRLLCVSDDRKLVHRFANYEILVLFWKMKDFQSQKDLKPKVEQAYHLYSRTEFSEEFRSYLERLRSRQADAKADFDKWLKKKYSKSWSGLSVTDRMARVVKLEGDNDGRDRGLDFLFGLFSQETHPTPWSVFPHYSAFTGEFGETWAPSNEHLRVCEFHLFLMFDEALDTLSKAVIKKHASDLRRDFDRYFNQNSRVIRREFYKQMVLVLATNNQDKIREIKHLLDDLLVTVLTRDDFLEFPDVEETGATLEENARLKACAIAKFCDLPALADDSGLEVDALNGAPGVHSSRYAGEDATYADNNRKLLQQLQGVPREKRTARFRCVILIDWADGTTDTVEGVAEGYITEDTAGREGFGYDPVFFYPPEGKRFSEMTLEEKNLVSHRGRALQKARDVIIERLNRQKHL